MISMTTTTFIVSTRRLNNSLKANTKKQGVLLINLGTPKSTSPEDVGIYLKEFLMDPLVIDIPYLARWILVNWLVIPKRKFASAKLYENIWTAKGSPLLFHSEDLTRELGKALDMPVWLAMRYGQPSIESAIDKVRASGVTDLIVVPLYPQYSLSATESSIVQVKKLLHQHGLGQLNVDFLPAFYNEDTYLDAVAEISKPYLDDFAPDKVLFSFHGLPERHVKKTDLSGNHCLQLEGCCEVLIPANKNCYRAQSFWTAKWLAKRLGIKDYVVGFQSRLGRTPWIQPYSDHFYESLPKEGVKRLAVISPSFVADCLETLEEIGIRAVEQFREAGGSELLLVPSLNSNPIWVRALKTMIEERA